MANATITVPVSSFVAAGSGFCPTGALSASSTPAGRVTISPTNSNNIVVTSPGRGQGAINLDFVVTSTETPAKTYAVCGLAITNSGLNGNFSLGQINNNVLSLSNRYTRGKTSWKLYIAVMFGNQLGIIDPGIENSDDA